MAKLIKNKILELTDSRRIWLFQRLVRFHLRWLRVSKPLDLAVAQPKWFPSQPIPLRLFLSIITISTTADQEEIYRTVTPSPLSYVYEGTEESIFGIEYNLETNTLRAVHPLSNTFCSAGSFYKNGTQLNLAGAEDDPTESNLNEGFNKLRTYAPGPCNGGCNHDWSEQSVRLQRWSWYPFAQTLVDGNMVIVGGSKAGELVLNEASINEPTYEIIHQDDRLTTAPVLLPILDFTEDQNLDPGRSYNLYPICIYPSP